MLSVITFVALANVALVSASHYVVDEAHWVCPGIPTNEWTNHYCKKGQPHVNPAGGVAGSESDVPPEDDEAEALQNELDRLEAIYATYETPITEAEAILSMPDDERVLVEELHLFDSPAEGQIVQEAETEEAAAPAVAAALPDLPHSASRACEHLPTCRTSTLTGEENYRPCDIKCCMNDDCACRQSEELGGCAHCNCEKIAQVWYHERSIYGYSDGRCWKTTVEETVTDATRSVFHKVHTPLTLDQCCATHGNTDCHS